MKTKGYMAFYQALRATLCVLPAAALLAGCANPSAPSPAGEGTGNTVEIGIGIDGNLGITGGSGNSVIYKDKEPSALTLRVTGEGWTGLAWTMDGRSLGTGEAVTINAADYGEARHTAALTGVHGGKPYGTTIPVTVTREWAGVTWTQTKNDSSSTAFDLAAWAGDAGPVETWSLSVIEQGAVYFAVRKPPQALITLGAEEGATVTQAAPGEVVDGSTANAGLDLFTVRPAGDALFGEGEGRFTLTASEPGKQAKTVNVTVTIKPNLTGVAVFLRDGSGSLARITAANAADHANSLYAEHTAGGFPAWGLDFTHVRNLSTALKWLDNYAQSGTPQARAEYLIRLEADEAMPKTLLSCRMNSSTGILADYVTIRIRGYGGEWRISHDPANMDKGVVNKVSGNSMSANEAFLSIGPHTDSSYVPNHLELRLEKNVTIDAGSGTDPYFPNTQIGAMIASMITVIQGNTLVMEAGSKLTNYTYTPTASKYYDHTAVVLSGGVFELRGGEISNIRGYENLVLCPASPAGAFTYYDGVFSGNTGNKIAVGSYYNPNFYDVTDPRFKPVNN